jgi:presenilin-like A22 family membrane protease
MVPLFQDQCNQKLFVIKTRSYWRVRKIIIIIIIYLFIYLFLTAIGLTAGGSSTVHTYAQTVHRKTQ